MRDVEEDHLIPLSLGGAPRDPRNLWAEPRYPPDGWTADMKDDLEAVLPRLVCMGRVSLAEARRVFATDWREGYQHYIVESETSPETAGE